MSASRTPDGLMRLYARCLTRSDIIILRHILQAASSLPGFPGVITVLPTSSHLWPSCTVGSQLTLIFLVGTLRVTDCEPRAARIVEWRVFHQPLCRVRVKTMSRDSMLHAIECPLRNLHVP